MMAEIRIPARLLDELTGPDPAARKVARAQLRNSMRDLAADASLILPMPWDRPGILVETHEHIDRLACSVFGCNGFRLDIVGLVYVLTPAPEPA